MSDTDNTQDPYLDGEVPADADLSTPSDGATAGTGSDSTGSDSAGSDSAGTDSAEEVAEVLPGGGRLNEAEDDPNVDPRDIRPGGDAPLP